MVVLRTPPWRGLTEHVGWAQPTGEEECFHTLGVPTLLRPRGRSPINPHYARDAVGEIVEMVVPPGNRRGLNLRRTFKYVARCEARGRPEGRPYPRSQQVVRA